MSRSLGNILALLPAFKAKMFYADPLPSASWSEQRWLGKRIKGVWKDDGDDVIFFNMKRELTTEDLLDHFRQEEVKCETHRKGSLGFVPVSRSGRVKVWCCDADSEELVSELKAKFIPVLAQHDINYIFEYGGKFKERCHLWIFCDTNQSVLKRFIEVLMKAAFGKKWQKRNRGDKAYELYGSHLTGNMIRLMGGLHLRAGYANPILFDGVESSDPEFVIKSVIECRPVSESYMIEVITDDSPYDGSLKEAPGLEGWKRRKQEYHPKSGSVEVKYIARTDLVCPFPKAPPFLKELACQCQTINKILWMIKNEEFLEDRGTDVHRCGVLIRGILQYGASKIAKSEKEEQVYHDFAEWLISQHRYRNWFSHGWHRNIDPAEVSRGCWRCETIDETFHRCKGCPFKDMQGFANPRVLWPRYGVQIRPKVIEKTLRSTTNEEVRDTVFKYAAKKVIKAAKLKTDLTLAIASGQGTGKSYLVDEIVSLLRSRTKTKFRKILIAVPTGKLAMMHRNALRERGVDATLLLSHNNLFKLDPPEFGECPFGQDIQELIDLGVNMSSIKSKYCKCERSENRRYISKCKFRDRCSYPTQFSKIEGSKVVICQHAHFRAADAMRILKAAKFDVAFIDENFVDNLQTYIKSTPAEKAFFRLNRKKFPFLRKLLLWLSGTPVKLPVSPSVDDMRSLKSLCKYHCLPFNVPDYLRRINDGVIYNKLEGLHRFHPLIQTPITVFTDATLRKEVLRLVLNTEDIEFVGHNQLVNVKLYNPKNKIIKVIDGSNSKSAQSDTEKMEKILHFIGMKGVTDYRKLTILITCYKDDTKPITDFFAANYPKLMKRLTISHMAVGVNDYKDTNVQFLLCGVHFNSLQYAFSDWEFTNIENFWCRVNDRPEGFNPFPHGVTATSGIPSKSVPVKLKLLVDGEARLVEFEEFRDSVPIIVGHKMIHALTLGMTQQAMRLRFHDDNIKIVYDWSKRYRPGILFTDVMLESQALGPVEHRYEEI